jgi:hypothetical protein
MNDSPFWFSICFSWGESYSGWNIESVLEQRSWRVYAAPIPLDHSNRSDNNPQDEQPEPRLHHQRILVTEKEELFTRDVRYLISIPEPARALVNNGS